ncbi:hypothetical protein [Gordonia sp. (in: high G+C Gram-positive bacteria)]|uniref:hypothetical protein n=1 Tax=Gordonia sp. (in: high G+C Gram-positive bacteria) TaxID=84139 RepID=UPI002631D114|nr:hypothetical protein [Gordonia sp. (in: high G+C Gram-positive bacteria)]
MSGPNPYGQNPNQPGYGQQPPQGPPPGHRPPPGYGPPPQGYAGPPQQAYPGPPPQGYPGPAPQGYPQAPQGYPQPQQGHPQQGYPQQGHPQPPAGPALGAGLGKLTMIALWVVVGAGALTFIASFLPWVSVGDKSYLGISGDADSDGVWTLILGLLGAAAGGAALFLTVKQKFLPLIAGGVAALFGLIVVIVTANDISDVGDARDAAKQSVSQYGDLSKYGIDVGAAMPHISTGFGLWLALFGGVLLLLAGAGAIVAAQFVEKGK